MAGTTPVVATDPMRRNRVYGSGKEETGYVAVKGKSQTAKIGGVVGLYTELKLLSLQQDEKGLWTAVLQVGDADPFDALTGQVYYVL